LRNAAKLPLLVTASTFPTSSQDSCPRFVLDLCRELEATGRIRCLTLVPHAPGAKARATLEGIRVHRYHYALPSTLQKLSGSGMMAGLQAHPWRWCLVPGLIFGQMLAQRKLEKKFQPAAVLAHWLVPQGITAVLTPNRRSKLIVVCHGGDVDFLSRGQSRRMLGRWLVQRCDRLIAVSTFVQEALIRRFNADPSKISVIPMGVDTKLFSRQKSPASQNAPHQPERLLYIGRLVPGKGLDILLDALRLVMKSRPLAELDIIGKGPLDGLLRKRVAALGLNQKVHFHGGLPHSRLCQHLRNASALVVPSVTAEGFGLVIAEAFAAQVPVVAAESGGIGNLIAHNQNGLLARPSCATSLARQINRLLADPKLRRRLVKTAWQRCQQDFRWEITANAFLKEIEAVVGLPVRETPMA